MDPVKAIADKSIPVDVILNDIAQTKFIDAKIEAKNKPETAEWIELAK